jgi:hypothetical protein
MDDSTFDLEQFRQGSRITAPSPARAARRPPTDDVRFLRGPIPLAWLTAAGRLPTRALHVAVALAFLSGVERTRVGLKVPPKLLTEFGLNRFARYRALNDLERAGLITIVQRAPGRCPVVTLCMDEPATPSLGGGRSP